MFFCLLELPVPFINNQVIIIFISTVPIITNKDISIKRIKYTCTICEPNLFCKLIYREKMKRDCF